MKKLMIALCTLAAFALTADAAPSTQAKLDAETNLTKFTPPHGSYRIGDFYRRLPRYASRVMVNGNVYFTHRGAYFQRTRRGYVVVQRPRVYRPVQRYNRGNGYYNRGNGYYNRGYDRGYNNGYRYGSPYNRGGCRR